MAQEPKDDDATTVRGAVDRMMALRAEHKPILDRIVSDGGMSTETRRALVDHLQLEEDEKLAAIARLTAESRGVKPGSVVGKGGGPPPSSRATTSGPSGATVGSLRRVQESPRDRGIEKAPAGTVGSLRKS